MSHFHIFARTATAAFADAFMIRVLNCDAAGLLCCGVALASRIAHLIAGKGISRKL